MLHASPLFSVYHSILKSYIGINIGPESEAKIILYSRKFLRGPIFMVFTDDRITAKIKPAKQT